MKIRTIRIWLSKGWYYAVYSVSLLLIPLITSCSSSRSTAKSSASKEAAVADNKTDGSPAEIKGYRKWGWSPSVALFGIKGRNGIFEVMSTEVYDQDLKGGLAGAVMINSFQLYK